MIDVVIADHQELFRIGMAEVLAAADDLRIVAQPRTPEQLLNSLKGVTPHVLILSTSFLPAFLKIQRMLKRRQPALLVLTEDNDRTAYVRWLRAHGVVYRSMHGLALVDAMRRVARGELFVQNSYSDVREDPSEVARGRTGSRNRIPVILSVDENSATLYARYKVLQGAGYGVLSVTNGEQALSMVAAYPVDLVLLDSAMPGMDGEIITHKIKHCKQNVPVIAVSADPIPEETLACADCVVTKAQGPALLLKKIGQLLAPLSAVRSAVQE
jgi:DNA-binding NarL/FixJ family response regulator